ncbi:UDP-glucose 4-epimerase [Variovorax boronicumulans]|uniref:NAD-dependent epimerase/dehydratase family protein n=1 Tax=Variovorax boronicumulans TaxID=436515 RepID=UPI00277DA75F|nr:NAD(P)-dependent oxidoreductase [Variovorax boronicumulans]MDP9912553.1 UDP-glucose 4-epimerase [Variovorax boronicumulans]
MTTLITGAGLLGRLIARQLVEQDERVVLADVRCPPPGELDGLALELCDVTDWEGLCGLIKRHRVRSIVHTAAMLTPAIRRDPLAGVRVNVMGTAHVLEAARRFELGRVVIASSTTVMYSAFNSLPFEPIDEDFSYRIVSERPGSIYAVTKVAGEHLALAYAQLHGVDTVVLRIGAVLGVGAEAASSVPGQMIECLLQAGRAGRPARFENPNLLWGGQEEFVDARDCAAAHVAALRAKAPIQRIYNIGTGRAHTFEELLAMVRRHYPTLGVVDLQLPEGGLSGFPHQRPAASDVSAASRELRFEAAYSLQDTVDYLVAPHGPS